MKRGWEAEVMKAKVIEKLKTETLVDWKAIRACACALEIDVTEVTQ